MMQKKVLPLVFGTAAISLLFLNCSAPATQTKQASSEAVPTIDSAKATLPKADAPSIPANYKSIAFPEFKYVAPFPADFRVKISDSITGYVIEDRTLPLIHFNVFFQDSFVTDSLKNEAAYSLLSAMFRRGGSVKLSPQALDDSLEFIAASLAGSVGTFQSLVSVECLSKDFPQLLALSKEVFLSPAFDEKALEIQKANAANAYEHRFDTPGAILSALDKFANYEPNPRLWDATGDEYRRVSRQDLLKIAHGKFKNGRIVFALSGDFDKDSMTTTLQRYFKEWTPDEKSAVAPNPKQKSAEVQPIRLKNKPGTYLVDKDISQANISMSAPFVKRPDPDYYPAAVASYILGGGSFSSRLMASVRSDNGLAYSIHSYVDNDYHDQGLVTIALQTKVESAAKALELIRGEIEKLAKDGPTDSELADAKKSLVESLPSLFDSPSNTAVIFASGELLGKKDSHYIDYVNEINAVTAEQVKAMTAKYFDPKKMTISIVGPAEKMKDIGNFTQVPLDSLDFRK